MTSIDAIINRQLLRWELQRKKAEEEARKRPVPPPIVTISRQSGSRGSYFASRLAEKMDYQRLHREVIDTICESAGYRKRIVESIDEKFRGDLELMVESLFTGKTVDHRDYLMHLGQIVLSMSQLGGVILMGRGGNFILGPKRGFHMRFIAPKSRRIQNLVTYKQMSQADAAKFIDESDRVRREFIEKLFDADIDNPCHYDLVVNAEYMDVEELLGVGIAAIKAKFDKLTFLDHDRV
ncbi:MAG: cytidylate kinase-like family protein [Candidatus Zixiibacteriota bacterium]|nr:MAG: cytidylate kinase-like family protein [candidate division Zixibacteria bacterium]